MNEERFSPRYGQESYDEEQPKRSRFESVVDFLRRSHEKDDDQENDDSERSARRKKGKSSRWRRFFRRMFGGGEQENENQSLGEEQSSRVPLISFDSVRIARKEMVSEEDPIERPQSAPREQEYQETTYEPKGAPREADVPEEAQTEEPWSVETAPGQNGPDVSEVNDRQHELRSQQHPTQEFTKSDTRDGGRKSEKDRENIKNPTGALLALDYLNYRGRKKLSRKLEKEQREQNEQLRESKNRLEQQRDQLNAQRDHLVAEQKQRKVEQERKSEETQPQPPMREMPKKEREPERPAPLVQPEVEVTFDHEERNIHKYEEDNTQAAKKEKELARERLHAENRELIELRKVQEEERNTIRQQARERERLEYERRQNREAQKIDEELLRTESAFVEKEHERHNEIKDQNQRLAPATSVGAVLRERPSVAGGKPHPASPGSGAPLANSDAGLVPNGAPQRPSSDFVDNRDLYKTAVKNGFATAAVLIASAITITLML